MDMNVQHQAPSFGFTPNDRAEGRDIDREFYGLLLHANRRGDDAGSYMFWWVLVATFAAGVAIHMKWVDALLSTDLEMLRGWSVYVLIAVIGFVAAIVAISMLETAAYRGVREEIRSHLTRTSLSRNELIAHIAGDEKLKQVSEQLQKDARL